MSLGQFILHPEIAIFGFLEIGIHFVVPLFILIWVSARSGCRPHAFSFQRHASDSLSTIGPPHSGGADQPPSVADLGPRLELRYAPPAGRLAVRARAARRHHRIRHLREPCRRLWVLISTRHNQELSPLTLTVTITPVRNAGDGESSPRSCIIATCAARTLGLSRTKAMGRSRSKWPTGGHHFTS